MFKNKKYNLWFSLFLIIAGSVFAFSSLITNEYLKLVVVFATWVYGFYGIMKSLSNPSEEDVACDNENK